MKDTTNNNAHKVKSMMLTLMTIPYLIMINIKFTKY